MAGFSLGGWQGRSDSPTGAQDRQAASGKWAAGLTSLMDTDTAAAARPIILSSSELGVKHSDVADTGTTVFERGGRRWERRS